MPRTRIKKTKSLTELTQKKARLESLTKILPLIYQAHTAKKLKSLIEKELPALCGVDAILPGFKEPKPKNSKFLYTYSFTYKQNDYFICFHKAQGGITDKTFLKKIGKALSFSLIQREEDQQLKTDKEKWELAFDTIATAICLTTAKGNILKTNKIFREQTHKSKTELLQKNYFSVFFGKNNEAPLTAQNKNRQKRITKNGKEQIFEILIQKVSQDIEPSIYLIIIRDITKQTEMENKIAKSAKLAEVGIIAGSIAHELNNPIAGIQALLETLQMQNQDQKLKEDLNEMSKAIKRCSHIIHKLLNIHR